MERKIHFRAHVWKLDDYNICLNESFYIHNFVIGLQMYFKLRLQDGRDISAGIVPVEEVFEQAKKPALNLASIITGLPVRDLKVLGVDERSSRVHISTRYNAGFGKDIVLENVEQYIVSIDVFATRS